jgi:squalene-associated FAD-dependent desaturase
VALAEQNVAVTLLEAKRTLGGRAGSFDDPATGETVDLCQHVAMGCCTNFLAFCRRTGIDSSFRRDRTLNFLSPEGKRSDFRGSTWLPAPLHLAPALQGLSFLSSSARRAVTRGMRALARQGDATDITVGQWLTEQQQPQEAIERFWSVVLVSALGESLDRAALSAARKVFVDGFMAHRDAYHVLVPTRPLVELYEQFVAPWLIERGVTIRRSTPAMRLIDDGQRITGIELADGPMRADHIILAVPWRTAARLLRGSVAEHLAEAWSRIESSPITGVHLWFDRPITDLPHALIVGRLSQWLFARSNDDSYYQVVISASRQVEGRATDDIVAEVLGDLRTVLPESSKATLLQSRVVTPREAVFSVTPQFEALRPAQATAIPGLTLAGDWTRTGWPSTMESAVRSGHLAAEAVLASLGQAARLLEPDLPRSCWTRFL